MDFRATLANDAKRIEDKLNQLLQGADPLIEAMRYAVLGGGKRLRAHLVYETARIFNIDQELADQGAMAIELIHAYSLVHDDLPAMDDDDMRRGRPTVHIKWNEWTAILVGDALQARAFEIIDNLTLAQSLAKAAEAMVRGQFHDLSFEKTGQKMRLGEIEAMQRDKTGALINWSACFGAKASASDEESFVKYAHHLGLAFQIWDDVLDVTASSAELGKTAGKDIQSGKATFVSHLGLEAARKEAASNIEAAKSAIVRIDGAQNLRALADFVITRAN